MRLRLKRNPSDYLLDDFEERERDFMDYFYSKATKRDLRMIYDRRSFEYVLQNVFGRDKSLKYWVANVGSETVDKFYETRFIQKVVILNRRRGIISPTLEERKVVRKELIKAQEEKEKVIEKKKKFVKAYIKGRLIRAVKLEIKIKGKSQTRYRDTKTGRWASIKKK